LCSLIVCAHACRSDNRRRSQQQRYSDAESGRLSRPGPGLLNLRTIYEGPAGRKASKLLHKTSLVITNRTVEIEREG
jgi:hypothetical protein